MGRRKRKKRSLGVVFEMSNLARRLRSAEQTRPTDVLPTRQKKLSLSLSLNASLFSSFLASFLSLSSFRPPPKKKTDPPSSPLPPLRRGPPPRPPRRHVRSRRRPRRLQVRRRRLCAAGRQGPLRRPRAGAPRRRLRALCRAAGHGHAGARGR